ncbi:MAG TPA: response regulator transcription factor [Chthoniobacterales bacterium]|jgi:DNA-binding NarL/FixJ family response regulator|nr:response regulator transcription factor [Chthoniobacterales bacterium]
MAAPPRALRILVADDHDIVRRGTRAVLESHPGWQVCGLAANGREAVARAIELKPDIVVIDMTMPELNGVDAAIQIKRQLPDTEILMFSGHESEDLIRRAFEAGVKSFIFKSEAHNSLVDAVDALSQHKPFFTAKVSEILFSNIVNRTDDGPRDETDPGQTLSAREREIVQLIAGGKSNKEVAEAFEISVRTVETHRASILRKLNLDSVAGLVRYAIRNHLIEP